MKFPMMKLIMERARGKYSNNLTHTQSLGEWRKYSFYRFVDIRDENENQLRMLNILSSLLLRSKATYTEKWWKKNGNSSFSVLTSYTTTAPI